MAEDTALAELLDTPDVEEQTPADELETLLGLDGDGETDEQPDEESETEEAEAITREEAERLAEERAAAVRAEIEAEQAARAAEQKAQWERDSYTRLQQQAHKDRTGEALKSLEGIAKWAYEQGENGRELTLNPQVLGQLSERIEGMVFDAEWTALNNVAAGELQRLAPGWRPPQELMQRLSAAYYRRDPREMMPLWFEYLATAAKEARDADAQRERETEQAEQERVAAQKKTETARKAQGRPTPVGGGTPAARRSHAQILSDPDSASVDDLRKALLAETGLKL